MFDGARPPADVTDDRFDFPCPEAAVPDEGAWALDSRPSLLIVAEARGQAELEAMATGAGFRVAGTVSREGMAERLAITVGVDAILLDLRDLSGTGLQLARIVTALSSWPGWCPSRLHTNSKLYKNCISSMLTS